MDTKYQIFSYESKVCVPCVLKFVSFNINKTGVTSWSGTVILSGAPEFTHGFHRSSCYPILSFLCICCPFSFGHSVVLSSDNPFGIFKFSFKQEWSTIPTKSTFVWFINWKCVLFIKIDKIVHLTCNRGRRGHMVVGFTTTCAISTHHH